MILVTGASGFVGRHVVRELATSGTRVRAMVRTARGASALEGIDCELVRGDVTDPASLRAASRGMRTIVHLVSIVEGSPATFERVMATGTGNLVEAARETAVTAHRPDERPRHGARRDRSLLPRQVGGRAGGLVLRRRARRPPPELRLRDGRRCAATVPADRPPRPRHARDRPREPNGCSRSGSATSCARSLSRWRPRKPRAPVELGGPEAVTWSEFWRRLKVALGTRRPAVHVPFWLARGPAALFERMPPALVTRDQLRMLEGPDNVVTDGGASMRRLGLGDLVPLDEQLRRAVASQ